MGMRGYAFLHLHLRLTAIEPARPARTAPVTRVTPSAGELLIPRHVAPESSDPLA